MIAHVSTSTLVLGPNFALLFHSAAACEDQNPDLPRANTVFTSPEDRVRPFYLTDNNHTPSSRLSQPCRQNISNTACEPSTQLYKRQPEASSCTCDANTTSPNHIIDKLKPPTLHATPNPESPKSLTPRANTTSPSPTGVGIGEVVFARAWYHDIPKSPTPLAN